MSFLLAVPSCMPGGLDAQMGMHFGHCDIYTIVEIEDNAIKAVGTLENVPHQQGGCMAPVQHLASHGVKALLAGGMGIVPFVGYVSEHPKPWNVTMLFGHREPLSCYPVDSINEHVPLDSLRETVPGDLDNFIFTIQERMREYAEQKGLILACGPLPFLKTVHGFARELNARVQLSLENRMACGVGPCLGCVTRTTEEWPVADKRNGLVQTCNHGPVFWANQIEL